MVFTIVSFAVLIGPPIEGALISSLGDRYVGAQAFAGSSLVLGSVFLTVAREIKRRKQRGKQRGQSIIYHNIVLSFNVN